MEIRCLESVTQRQIAQDEHTCSQTRTFGSGGQQCLAGEAPKLPVASASGSPPGAGAQSHGATQKGKIQQFDTNTTDADVKSGVHHDVLHTILKKNSTKTRTRKVNLFHCRNRARSCAFFTAPPNRARVDVAREIRRHVVTQRLADNEAKRSCNRDRRWE